MVENVRFNSSFPTDEIGRFQENSGDVFYDEAGLNYAMAGFMSRAGLEPATHWLKEPSSRLQPVTALQIYTELRV